jgi:glutamyl endopeptidase
MREKTINRVLLALAYIIFLFAFVWATAQAVPAQAPSRQEQERAILRYRETRVAVQSTVLYPFSAVVRIVSTFPNGERAVGSGAFVGPNRVVTAGHIVYDSEAGGYARHINITPGYANGEAPFGSTYASYMQTTKGYKNDGDPDYDFAMLTTADELGRRTGWLGLKATDNSDLGTVLLCGYPDDLGGTRQMYFAGGRSWWANSHRLQYEFWTDSGMSGGPLINYNFYIVGIHTGGNSNYNYGVSINQQWPGWF